MLLSTPELVACTEACFPLNDTVAPFRLLPLIVTCVPTGPLWGVKLWIEGAALRGKGDQPKGLPDVAKCRR